MESGDENDNIANDYGIDAMVTPSTSSENEDHRIKCTNSESLRSIIDVTLHQISELFNSYTFSDDPTELISHFAESFKSALETSIVIDGLPFRAGKSSEIPLPEKIVHLQDVDDAFLSKLSKTVADVAHKRKFCPEQCCRLLSIQMKHDLQNLKKATVNTPSPSSVSSTASINSLNKDRSSRERKVSEFCKTVSALQENVQCKLQQKDKLEKKISIASNIKKKQKL